MKPCSRALLRFVHCSDQYRTPGGARGRFGSRHYCCSHLLEAQRKSRRFYDTVWQGRSPKGCFYRRRIMRTGISKMKSEAVMGWEVANGQFSYAHIDSTTATFSHLVTHQVEFNSARSWSSCATHGLSLWNHDAVQRVFFAKPRSLMTEIGIISKET